MHLRRIRFDLFPKFRDKVDTDAAFRLAVKERSFRDLTAEHLLQTDCLCTKLKLIAAILFRLAALIFDRIRPPASFPSMQRNSAVIADKLDHIAFSVQPEPKRKDPQTPGNKQIAPAFGKLLIMSTLMKDIAFNSSEIFCPLLLDVDQRPLPFAKVKMLES